MPSGSTISVGIASRDTPSTVVVGATPAAPNRVCRRSPVEGTTNRRKPARTHRRIAPAAVITEKTKTVTDSLMFRCHALRT